MHSENITKNKSNIFRVLFYSYACDARYEELNAHSKYDYDQLIIAICIFCIFICAN